MDGVERYNAPIKKQAEKMSGYYEMRNESIHRKFEAVEIVKRKLAEMAWATAVETNTCGI